MDEAEQVDFMGSACNAFAVSINQSSGTRLGGKQGYEVLSLVFGETFKPEDLRGANPEQVRDLVVASWELLGSRVSPEAITVALRHSMDSAGE